MKALSLMELLTLRPWLVFQMNSLNPNAHKAQELILELDNELWIRLIEKKEALQFEDQNFDETLKSIINAPLKATE